MYNLKFITKQDISKCWNLLSVKNSQDQQHENPQINALSLFNFLCYLLGFEKLATTPLE